MHAGDLRVQVRHVGTAAHTTNDSIVWIPERSVLFCGDLIFNGGTPFLLMGSVAGAIEVLEQVIVPLGAQTIVPGPRPGVRAARRRSTPRWTTCRFVLDVAARARQAGLSPLRAARETDLGRFADWPDAERIVGNLHRACAELAGDAARRPHRRARRPGRHGRLQRRCPAQLPGLTRAGPLRRPQSAGPGLRP